MRFKEERDAGGVEDVGVFGVAGIDPVDEAEEELVNSGTGAYSMLSVSLL